MPLRITSPEGKLSYIVLGYVVAVTSALFGAAGANPAVGLLLYCAVVVLLIVVGARTFRGQGEDPSGTRPLWRMTAKPTAGFVLATLLILQAVTTAINAASVEELAPLSVLVALFYLGLAAAYVNSSLKLRSLA